MEATIQVPNGFNLKLITFNYQKSALQVSRHASVKKFVTFTLHINLWFSFSLSINDTLLKTVLNDSI